jgi:hypothetical protein
MAVVYTHQRLDNNEVFYVGIGKTSKRAFSKRNRNKYWKHITNKVGYSVEIIHNDVNWDEACELEKHLIFLFGRKDLGLGSLVNMTDGGEGMVGLKPWSKGITFSDEHKQKISESKKGNTNMLGKKLSEESKKKISESLKGRKLSEKHIQKMSEAVKGEKNPMFGKASPNKGVPMSEEQKQKLSEAHKGKTFSDEHKQKIGESKKGKKRSAETIAKIVATLKSNKLKNKI